MTPEQDLVIKRAEAVARAEAQAKAEQDAASGSNPNFSTTPSGLWTGTKNFVRSAGEGVAGLMDLPEQIVTGARNLPRRLGNAGVTYGGESFTGDSSPAPAPVELLNPENIYSTAYNKAFPVPQGYEDSWSRRIGNIAGPTALTLGVGAGPAIVEGIAARSLPAVLKTGGQVVADTALTTGGTVAGGLTGGAVGGAVGGEQGRQVGEFVGSVAGSSLMPAARFGGYKTTEKMFTDPESIKRLRAGEKAGVTGDLSLYGNQRAVEYSRGAGNEASRRRQQQEIDQSLRGSAREVGGVNYPYEQSLAPGDIGENVIKTAQNAADRAAAEANQTYDPMMKAMGRETAMDPALTRQGLETIIDPANRLYTDAQKATARDFLDQLNADRRYPIDNALHNNLLQQQARARANLASATPGSPLASAAQISLDKINSQIDANLGPSVQQSITQRAVGNQSIDKSKSYDKPTRKAIKEAQTAGLEQEAQKAGYTPEQFKEINQRYGDLKGEQKKLGKKIAGQDEPGAYSAVFSKEGEGRKKLWANLERNAEPSELAQILAQNLELRGRGPAAAGRPELPPDKGLNTAAVNWWDKLPETMRERYAPFGSELRAKINANMTLIRADARRGGASQIEQYPGVTLGGASLAMGRPELAAANFFPKVANLLVGRKLRDPQFAHDVITQQGGKLTPLDLARTMAAAVSNEQANAR